MTPTKPRSDLMRALLEAKFRHHDKAPALTQIRTWEEAPPNVRRAYRILARAIQKAENNHAHADQAVTPGN